MCDSSSSPFPEAALRFHLGAAVPVRGPLRPPQSAVAVGAQPLHQRPGRVSTQRKGARSALVPRDPAVTAVSQFRLTGELQLNSAISSGPLQRWEEPGRQRERHRRYRVLPRGSQVILLTASRELAQQL